MTRRVDLNYRHVLNGYQTKAHMGRGRKQCAYEIDKHWPTPLVVLLMFLGFLVYRTPQENIAQVWVVLGQMLDKRSGLGYTLGLVSSAGWAIHTRYQRKKFEKELERISEERNQAQQLHFNKKLDSSRPGSRK